MITASFVQSGIIVSRGMDRQEKDSVARRVALSTLSPANTDMDGLLSYIQRGGVIYPAHLKDYNAGVTNENFLHSNFILLDFDNDRGGNVLRWQDVALHSFTRDNAAFVFESPNFSDSNHRFRIGFVLPDAIEDYGEYEAFAHRVGDHYPQQFDVITRPTWGYKGCRVIVMGGGSCRYMQREVFHALVCDAYLQRRMETAPKEKQGDRLTLEQVKELLSYIPAHMAYEDWQAVVFGVSSELEEQEAIEAVESWSPGRDRHYINLIRRDKRRRGGGVTIATVVKLAQAHGWPGWRKTRSTQPV